MRTNLELHGYYDWRLVAFSLAIAFLASLVAVRTAHELITKPDISSPGMAGAVRAGSVLGLGIWAMHFTGMAAFHLDNVDVGYRWDITALSLLVAIIFTVIGFATAGMMNNTFEGIVVASIPMAVGVLAMHFLGMMAMTGEVEQHYDAWMVLLAGGIALTASIGALWLTRSARSLGRQLAAASAMALAISGMHYTGMHAATFHSVQAKSEAR